MSLIRNDSFHKNFPSVVEYYRKKSSDRKEPKVSCSFFVCVAFLLLFNISCNIYRGDNGYENVPEYAEVFMASKPYEITITFVFVSCLIHT